MGHNMTQHNNTKTRFPMLFFLNPQNFPGFYLLVYHTSDPFTSGSAVYFVPHLSLCWTFPRAFFLCFLSVPPANLRVVLWVTSMSFLMLTLKIHLLSMCDGRCFMCLSPLTSRCPPFLHEKKRMSTFPASSVNSVLCPPTFFSSSFEAPFPVETFDLFPLVLLNFEPGPEKSPF